MFHDEVTPNLAVRQRIRALRIVHAALVAGVLIFALVVWFIITARPTAPAPAAAPSGVDLNLLRLVAGVLTFTAVVMALVMRQAIMQRLAGQEEKPPDETLANAYFTASLIGNAMAESGALLACIIALMSRNTADFALVGAPVLLMLILTPTRSRWENFRQRVLNDRALRAGRSKS